LLEVTLTIANCDYSIGFTHLFATHVFIMYHYVRHRCIIKLLADVVDHRTRRMLSEPKNNNAV